MTLKYLRLTREVEQSDRRLTSMQVRVMWMKEVPGDDPEVQHVADHAVKTIQQRSNSLFPYELQEVVHANAEVTGEASKFNMLLKLKRGDKEEKFKVEVHKNHEGVLHLNHMEQHHD
ncbi:hypothetical protein F2Q68_00017873 [Brassica cretica]|uniref:Cysteine proteinase inhibitor n=1 Tax=Brassica cretica TaxID=69181 RepID=A0A8S9HEE9_BRACR|nr:hypothetical protein F2Q68_00017873 [Brassica cretica]